MKRREMLLASGAAVLGLSAFPFGWAAAAEKKKQKVLYFTRSADYEHPPVERKGNALSNSEKMLTDWGQEAGFEVVCSKDGRAVRRRSRSVRRFHLLYLGRSDRQDSESAARRADVA